ncbi:predicted protein [Sclerotinia sclerotiorum 1980 UF-70]|uniref:Uncharacterized protein n=1 Tax=Sclerotinia sclerotiorum (strain ATCC 18683 / 1980 / Ss-1) TaxID=665079 RepID=A7EA24_SCLS1|nr:predicted protein [Sclerotinia sclerotiorum 1980 UF-70]EDN99302.1 predicted protein [Sclerotinia sclerotiorum 1980 UF-70]
MHTLWPVIDYIGMIHEMNDAYKLSHGTFHAAVCYEKCNDLLAQIGVGVYFYFLRAHTHIILALLASPKTPCPPLNIYIMPPSK